VRHSSADPGALTVRCLENPDTTVRLYDPYFPDEDGIGFSVEVGADGLRAACGPVEVWVEDVDLPAFIAGLADDFAGRAGHRTWSANHLTIDATRHSRGRVCLRWTLQARLTRADGWSASVTTWLESGAQLIRLADEMRLLLPELRPRHGACRHH
jgi:hypothetical protein